MKTKKIASDAETRAITVKVVFLGSVYEYEANMIEPVGEKGTREIMVTVIPNQQPKIGSRLRDATGKIYDY